MVPYIRATLSKPVHGIIFLFTQGVLSAGWGKKNWCNSFAALHSILKIINSASTTIYDNLPSEYIEKLIKAIVGFEMEVKELENVHKLSQNRDEKSYDNIVRNLKEKEGDAAMIGKLMEERKPKVFPS